MPEGDTIWRTAAALRRRIEGKVVIEARPDRIRRLQGRHVLGVEPTGKHLIMRFDGNLALHSHMRMTGAWHLYRPGERWRQPAYRVRALLAFDDVVAVCFAAPVVELVADPRRPVAHLGPDILVHGGDRLFAPQPQSELHHLVGDLLVALPNDHVEERLSTHELRQRRHHDWIAELGPYPACFFQALLQAVLHADHLELVAQVGDHAPRNLVLIL